MTRPKKTRKKKAIDKSQGKKLLLGISIAGGLMVALIGVLLVFILKPSGVPDLPEAEEAIGKDVPIPYEETYVAPRANYPSTG